MTKQYMTGYRLLSYLLLITVGICSCTACAAPQQSDMSEQLQLDNTSSAVFSESVKEPQDESHSISETVPQTENNQLRIAKDVPQDFQQRIMAADEIDQLDLTGLSFAERCQLVILWKTTDMMQYEGGFGLVDLTLDGYPELYYECYDMGTDGDFYDLSGDRVRMVLDFSALESKSEYSVWSRETALLQGAVWKVYATVFPNGTLGGIVEECGNHRCIDTHYFTLEDGEYPIGKHLVVAGYMGYWYVEDSLAEDAAADGASEDQAYREIWAVGYGLMQRKEGSRYASELTDSSTRLYWETEEYTQAEFLAAVQDTWMGTFNALPRTPWLSPVIYPEGHSSYMGLSWSEIIGRVRQLLEEYNRQLEEGDYDLPLVN